MSRNYEECMHELKLFEKYGEFINGTMNATDEEKITLAKDAEVILFGSTYLKNEIIEKLPALKYLQFIGTGVANYVDIEFCRKRGIKVLNVEDYGSNSVAEYALAMILSCLRGIPKADAQMKNGVWAPEEFEGEEIEGATVGVLGTGKIGTRVVKKLKALDAGKILAFDMYQNEDLVREYGVVYRDLEDIFQESDIVTIHLKYSPETYQIVSRELINRMKKNAFLVNTARAELVDYGALVEALDKKKIKGAAIDVFYEEPVKDYSLCKLDNLITTPHIGFFSKKAKSNLIKKAVASIIEQIGDREPIN